MVDKDLILAKASSVKRHIDRVKAKSVADMAIFLQDLDRQESVAFNMHLAIQNCMDIAAHIISEEGLGVPGSAGDMFFLLQENGFISADLADKMVKAVGFRNLLVHEYQKIDLQRLYETAEKNVDDLMAFLASIFRTLDMA
jgi:uncharacterized protein YutE (UPF0331/DUF86 family)